MRVRASMCVRGGGFGDEGIPVAKPPSVTACGRFDARVLACLDRDLVVRQSGDERRGL